MTQPSSSLMYELIVNAVFLTRIFTLFAKIDSAKHSKIFIPKNVKFWFTVLGTWKETVNQPYFP